MNNNNNNNNNNKIRCVSNIENVKEMKKLWCSENFTYTRIKK